ncbi:SASB hydrolase, partial [Casuarius casuarius]|nr:SASB hydrolase [Casuarius casuarius]
APPELVHLAYDEYVKKCENGFLEALGDPIFVFPDIEKARYHRDAGNPVYFYEVQHRPSSTKYTRPNFVKADHPNDIGFALGKPFLAGDV